ncbi:hypothetical protein ABZY68_04660 [Streptomyces sp. NPDC006482]|uniref:hypothetical protein n=1 Tax=Streptomyces sp. NPDC006482 TaxID=3154306 RepID=UPI0033AF4C7A
MTQTPTLSGPFARPGRALAVAALASVALAGCGGQDGPGPSAESKASATSPSADRATFEAMLDTVARPCPPPGTAPVAPKPTGPQHQQSLAPGETPPTGPIEPGAPTGPATVLNARDWCASVQHEQRVIEVLQAVAKPTPASVRKALNGLGYIDEHIHGLVQDGTTTRFHLDLRESGGRLCEAGTAAGEVTEMTPCVAPATGPFTVEKSEDRTS